MAAERKQ